MVKKFFCLFLFMTLTVFGQNSITQENEIYNAVDAFVANPSAESIKKLDSAEQNFWKNPKTKTKNELLALVVLNCNKAYYENQFGKTNKAISSYEKAWQIFEKNKLSNYDIIEYCLKPLGNLYTAIGDFDNAENTIKHYYFIASTKKNQQQRIAAIINLSSVYQSNGKNKLAIALLENTIQTEKLTTTQKGNLLNNLGSNYILVNNNEEAKKSLQKSIEFLKQDSNQLESVSNAYRNLATIYRQERNYILATSYLEEARKLFLKTGNSEPRKIAKLDYERSLLLFEQNKFVEANTLITAVFKTLIPNYSSKKDILPNRNSLYAETVLLDALDLQAQLFLKNNEPKKALEAYTLSFQIENLIANLLLYENSKIINQIRIRNRTEKCISIYDYLYNKEKKIGYIESAFQLSERTKSGVLKSYLSNKKTASKNEKHYLELLQDLNNEIIKEQQKGNLAEVVSINEALKKQNQLMLSLKKIRSENQIDIFENIDIKSLYSKLQKDKAILVEYFSGFENMYSFTLKNNQIKMQSYDGSAHSKVIINQFLLYFSDANAIINDIKGYNKSGNILYEYLKLPKITSYQNLIIVPDGLLNFLPFEALITKKSTTTNFAKMHYLLNDFKIVYDNSASFYLAFDKLKLTKNSNKSVLGIFPVFEKTAYELAFSKDEMQSIKNNFDGQFFENTNATFNNFKTNAPNYSILHLSTHAASGDTETPASIKFYDQDILYSELYNLKINPNLVVLSACETGIGKLYKSEGAMSVSRGFQFAGSKNLLFSLWKVNDFTTAVFMNYFYTNVKKGDSYFEANANAKLNFLKDTNISNAKKSPYYWSAFVYNGGIETIEYTTNYFIYIFGLLTLIGLFLGFKAFKK